jgi:hypothetical protein
MDTARQVIRWALPGWIALLFCAGFIAVNAALSDQNQLIYLSILKAASDNLLTLAAIAVPVGFIIYQLYYWVYWYAPIPSLFGRRFIDPVDRGKEILDAVKDQVDFKQIFDNPLLKDTPESPFEKHGHLYYKSARIMGLYRKNWHLSDSAWYLALADERYKNTATFLERRNQLISDIYHSLGACYHAVTLAFLGYSFVFGYVSLVEAGAFFSRPTPPAPSTTIAQEIILPVILRLMSFTINLAIFLLGTRILRGGRIASFDALSSLKHDVITNVMLDRPTKGSKETDISALE